MALLPAVASVLWAGEPQCPPNLNACYYSFADATFGDPYTTAVDAEDPEKEIWGETREAVCNRTNWLKREECHNHCPLQLELTAPADLAGVTVCLEHNNFVPYKSAYQIDQNHPVHDQELEIVVAGTGVDDENRFGCVEHKDTWGNLTGKIAVMKRGGKYAPGCYFPNKFVAAGEAGAVAGILVNSRYWNPIRWQLFGMSGSSENVEIPAMLMPRQDGDALMERAWGGAALKGKIRLNCAPMPAVDPSVDLHDGCPLRSLRGICNGEENDEDRLCSECPLSLGFADTTLSICLWGHALLPRARQNYLQHQYALPHSLGQGDVALVATLPNYGCNREAYTGLAGKIVIARMPWRECPPYQAARYAAEAGVAAYIGYTRRADADFVEGQSRFVTIPVHSIDYDDVEDLIELAEANGTWFNETGAMGFYLPDGALLPGSWLPSEEPPAPSNKTRKIAAAEELLELPAFELNPTVVTLLVLIAVLSCSVLTVHAFQRLRAVDIPASGPRGKDDAGFTKDRFSLPLGVASMGLSLTMLALIAAVAFALAYKAGQDATGTAVENGQAAAAITFENAVQNVEELARAQREVVARKALDAVDRIVQDGEMLTRSVVSMFRSFDGTWVEFAAVIPQFYDFAYGSGVENWDLSVYTTNGFYVGDYYVTDDRPDWSRQDGQPHVSVTNAGYLYGVTSQRWLATDREMLTGRHYYPSAFNVSHVLGGEAGSPVDFVKDKAAPYNRGAMKWHLSREAFPQGVPQGMRQPMSVYTPLFNQKGEFFGAVGASMFLTDFGNALSAMRADPALRNLTAFLLDYDDKAVVAIEGHFNVKVTGQVKRTSWMDMRQMFTVFDIPPVEVNAFSNWVNGSWYAGKSGEFDQAEYYNPAQTYLTVMRFRGVNGSMVDVSGDVNEAEVRGKNCRHCPSTVNEHGAEYMRFDGGGMALHVYRNLTVHTPRIKQYANSYYDPLERWAVSRREFAEYIDIEHEDGNITRCIAYTYRPNPNYWGDTNCMMREAWFHYGHDYSISVAIKPDFDITDQLPNATTPRLFTDTAEGEVNFRLFGNGQFFMNIFDYGCRTAAPEGGIPGGAWTTITAVYSGRSHCSVYLNGTLSSRAAVSSGYSYRERAEPFLAGQHYTGLMDNLTVYNTSLDEKEIMSVHETGDVVRNVPPRVWLAGLQRFDKDERLRSGMNMRIAALLPREDIMREVQENNRITMRNLRVQEANTQAKLDQRSNETILTVVVIALAAVVIFLIFNDMLTQPFAQAAIVMADAAYMRIDKIPDEHSLLREMNSMNRAMALMLKNLKEFKSYMPQTLQFDSEADADAGETVADVISNGSVAATPSDVSRASSRSARSKSAVGSYVARSMGASNSSSVKRSVGVAHAARLGAAVSLTRKRVSFVVCNVHGWLQQIVGMTDTEVVKLHSSVLSLTLTVFQAHKGISEVFSGDRFVASFNAVRVCAMHRVAAADAALQVKEQAGVMEQPVAFHSSCVSGETRVGNCGNELMKKFSFMAPTFTWAFALERVAAQMEVPILADMFITDEAQQGGVMMKTVADVLFPKRLRKGLIRVSEVWGKRSSGETDEWMYEMQHAERSDPMAPWNAFATHVLNKDWEAAEDAKADAAVVDNGAAFERLAASLAEQVAHPVAVQHH